VALSVETLWAVGFPGGVAAARDDRQGSLVLDLLTHFLAVVGFVAGYGQRCSGNVEDLANDLAVVNLAAGYDEVQRTTFAVDKRVDFG